MGETVSVEQGGVTVTSNTVTEEALRQELETPVADPPGPGRDPSGRFTKKSPAEPTPGAEPEASAPESEAPARRRDDTLPRHSPIARMNQALAQKAEAERRAAALEARLAQLQAGEPAPQGPPFGAPAPPAPASAPEPQFEAFAGEPDPYTAYLQAWSRWDRTQALAQARAEWEAEQQQQRERQTIQARLAEGRQQYPDYDDKLKEADTLGLQVSAVMERAMSTSPHTADLVYFLATHPEECTQLAEESKDTPVAAVAVMRRLLESRLEAVGASAPRAVPQKGTGAAARVTTSIAKPPVTPVGSSPVVSDDPPGEAASAAEHARYWNRRLKVPGTR